MRATASGPHGAPRPAARLAAGPPAGVPLPVLARRARALRREARALAAAAAAGAVPPAQVRARAALLAASARGVRAALPARPVRRSLRRPRVRAVARDAAALRREARERLLRLGAVLLAASVVAPLLASASPMRAFVVASGSMEPVIPQGSLVVAGPGEPQVGDVIVYWSPVGAHQIHRLVEVRDIGGATFYFPRGDANDGTDSFAVPPEDVVGIYVRHVPHLGNLWLMPAEVQTGLFGALLALYLAITAWDARGLLRGRTPALLAGGLVLLLLLPAALGGVAARYPAASLTAAAADTPLPFSVGTAGQATITADRNGATATAAPPRLWREYVLWGCDPVGDTCIHRPAGSAYAPVAGSALQLGAADFDPAPSFHLEAYVRAPANGTVTVALLDRTANATVAASAVATSSTSYVLLRSGAFSLAAGRDVGFQTKVEGAAGGEVAMVKLLAVQAAPSKTATQVRIASADATSLALFGVPDRAQRWSFDRESMNGLTAAYFEAVANVTGGLVGTSKVRLVDRTANTVVATLDVPASTTAPTRFRSADLLAGLVGGREYEVEYAMGTGGPTDQLRLHLARVVLLQAGFTHTVNYVDLAWTATTAGTSFGAVGYQGRHPSDAWDSTVFFEATLHSGLLLESASARLVDASSGAEVAGTAISATSTSRTLVRTTAIDLDTSLTYAVQARSSSVLATATVSGAWLVGYMRIGERRTQDGSPEANHADLDNTPANVAGRHGLGYSLDGASQQLQVQDDAALRPASALTVMAWFKANASSATSRLVQKAGDASGYALGLDGSAAQLEASLAAGGQQHLLTAAAPAAGTWAHAALTYDGSRARLYLDGSEVASAAASGALDHTAEPLYLGLGSAATAVAAPTKLPAARANAAAASNGTHLFLFGGRTDAGLSDAILRYDPVAGTVTTLAAKLPSAREHASAAWSGSHVYVFGGSAASGKLDQVVRFDPANGTVATMAGRLPTPRLGTSAVWGGSYAYVFGGQGDNPQQGGNLRAIVRYDPAGDAAANMTAELPHGSRFTSAVWAQGAAYVFGGVGNGNANGYADIVRYDAANDTATLVDAALPTRRYGTSAAWDGNHTAYVVGGCGATCPLDGILAFDVTAGTIASSSADLPSPRQSTGAAWIGGKGYIAGGATAAGRTDEVVVFEVGEGRFSGVLDEVRVYGRALSASELASVRDQPYTSGGAATADPAHAVRLLGGEALALQMDQDDHFKPADGRTYDAILHTGTPASGCAWSFRLARTADADLGRLSQANVSLRGDALQTQLAVVGGALLQDTGTPVTVQPGAILEHVVGTAPSGTGTSSIGADLLGRCTGAGIHTVQRVTYAFT